MTVMHLLWANLNRKATRTALTFLSLVVAFLLFMLLRSIAVAFSGASSSEAMSRLMVDARYSMTDNLPLAYVHQIQQLDEVAFATPVVWFGGYYKEPRNSFAKYAIDPVRYFGVYPEYRIEPAVLERFAATRTGVVASRSLAERYGWRAGDVVPITGNIWPKANGSWDWRFELIGTFDYPESQVDQPILLLQHDYFSESVADWAKGMVTSITVRVTAPEQADAAMRTIDALYENSSDPVRSTTEDEYQRQFARQIGDIGAMTTMILAAVFFTILLLTGNTASQAFKERIPELAVMKTLGFSDPGIAALVLAEAVLLTVAGAAAGIALALALEPYLNANLATFIGRFRMDAGSAFAALGLAVAIGLVIGAQPAWAARRLGIAEALRR